MRVGTKKLTQRVGNSRADGRAGDCHVDHGQRLVGVAAGTDVLGRDACRIECGGVRLTFVA